MSIKIENLTHIYAKGTPFEKTAINNINLEINDGEFVGIIGHTGSGKSSLVQHLNALLKPTSGSVFIDDEDIFADKSKLKELRYKVGLVFQYPEHQLFEMTILKDVAFGPANMGLAKDEIQKRAKEALNLVGIDDDLFEKSPFELSGGQKRRVAIAGVLAMQPKVLILDEPTAGLDPAGRDEILAQIEHMHKTLGITVILVSHSMEDVAKLASKIFVINHGEIALSGTPAQVFSEIDKLEAIGLSSTQAAYLIKKLQQKGFNLPNGIYEMDEAVKAILSQLA